MNKNSFLLRKVSRLVYCIGILLSAYFAYAQTKPIICKAYAFFEVRSPGTLRVDDKGKPVKVKPDTTFMIYAETSTKDIHWENVWKNGRCYDIASATIVPSPYEAGREKAISEGRLITLVASKNNYLWQLYANSKYTFKRSPSNIQRNQILLVGRYKNKSIFKKIENIIELSGLPAP